MTTSSRQQWPTEEIVGPFEDDLEFLSNYYPVEVYFHGRPFPSSEHAYQACKAFGEDDLFERIRQAEHPDEAKHLGRQADLPDDWGTARDRYMLEIVTAKFAQHPALADRLCTTEGPIVELNWWGDTYWGADLDTGEGKNMLGRILMGVRDTLRHVRS
jgi:ribA/ribD-fused uncharacterized protein